MNPKFLFGLCLMSLLSGQEPKPVTKPKQEPTNARDAFIAAISECPPKTLVGLNQEVALTGEFFLVVEAATNEFRAKCDGTKLAQYEILITNLMGQTVIFFQNPNRPPMIKGSAGPLPEFEVTLSKDHKVIQSHYSR